MKYSDSGVDIDKGDSFTDQVKVLAKSTKIEGVVSGIGGFAGVFDITSLGLKQPLLVTSTDGVGTKLVIANKMGKHDTIGIDLVAMCVNDIVVQGAKPSIFLDYIAIDKLDTEIAIQIMIGVTEGCRQAKSVLIGGETAEMPGIYKPGGYDLAGFSIGFVEKADLLPKKMEIKEGDVLLGLKSSGFHSNGFSLVRRAFAKHGIQYQDNSIFDNKKWGEILLEPTIIYTKTLQPLMQYIKAAVHITGGGLYNNIIRVMPKHCNVQLNDFEWPELFQWFSLFADIKKGEMMKTFNCGIGMVLVVSKERVENIKSNISEDVLEVGRVVKC